jgi:glycosyltransferase involved in cell wall biosynthesis
MNMASRSEHRVIVMLGIDPASKEKGGISSVVDVYRANGLFARWRIQYIGTMVSGSHATKLRIFATALWAFMRVVRSGRISLVHAHTASRASFWRKSVFMLIARAADIPVILHLHGGEFELFYRNECGPLRRAYIRFVLSKVNRVVVLSTQWCKRVASIAPAAKITAIVNPVVVPSIIAAVDERQPNDLLFLGRLDERKGIFDLLQACAIVRPQFPALRLRCGGDGDAAAVQAKARELGLEDCVQLLGWVNGAAKDRELMQAAIYVLPSYAEGLPMGVLEAMAAGTPTIATTVGGIPDAIEDGVNGFMVEPGDVVALAERIARLLGDAELSARFATAARAKVISTFSPDRVLAQLEDLYKRLGAQPRPVRITHAHSPAETRERLDLSVGDR